MLTAYIYLPIYYFFATVMDTAWYYLFSLRADMAGVVHGRSTKETPHPGQTIIIGRVARL